MAGKRGDHAREATHQAVQSCIKGDVKADGLARFIESFVPGVAEQREVHLIGLSREEGLGGMFAEPSIQIRPIPDRQKPPRVLVGFRAKALFDLQPGEREINSAHVRSRLVMRSSCS